MRLIVFLKAPRPGAVKTRLAADLGWSEAAVAYKALVEATLDRIGAFPDVELRFAPDDARAEIELWRRPGWRLTAQGSGDLGARLHRAFADAATEGCRKIIVIGSDCPGVALADILDAERALDAHEVTLGPAADGGYWLIGLRGPIKALFEGISWSTERVLDQTETIAGVLGFSVKRLRMLEDVDTVEAWTRWRASTGDRVQNP